MPLSEINILSLGTLGARSSKTLRDVSKLFKFLLLIPINSAPLFIARFNSDSLNISTRGVIDSLWHVLIISFNSFSSRIETITNAAEAPFNAPS